jgi:cobalt/nickel transport protein
MSRKAVVWLGIAAALLIAVFLSPYASPHPDGLERVAIDNGFMEQEKGDAWSTPFSGYEWKGLSESPLWAKGLSGLAGVLLTLGAVYGTGRLLARRKPVSDGKPKS